MRGTRISLLTLFILAGCDEATEPVVRIDPYALFYVRNDKPTSPIYYAYVRFPNRTPIEEGLIGSVGSGEQTCGSFGLDSIIPDDPANMVQLVFYTYRGDSVTNPITDSLKSPTVDPFALGANTPDTPHRFRLWWKDDGTTFFDFGLWNDSTRWAAPPGWPCPTRF